MKCSEYTISIETKSRLVFAKSCSKVRIEINTTGHGVSFGGNENILKLYNGGSCTTL